MTPERGRVVERRAVVRLGIRLMRLVSISGDMLDRWCCVRIDGGFGFARGSGSKRRDLGFIFDPGGLETPSTVVDIILTYPVNAALTPP